MILVDYSAVSIAAMMAILNNPSSKEECTEMFCYHVILNSIRATNMKFRKEYGQMYIICDARKNWRREYFEQYKANRAKGRKESKFDFELIFHCLDTVKAALNESFPYHVMEMEGLEADDIIGILAQITSEQTIIISNDKDFQQLHNENVCQYRPHNKKVVRNPDPKAFLIEHIVRGDKDDGVPNILSVDTVFVDDNRQKPVTQKRYADLYHAVECILDGEASVVPVSDDDKTFMDNFHRNNTMINLLMIPTKYREKVIEDFNNLGPAVTKKKDIIAFFNENRMRMLAGKVNDFTIGSATTLSKFF